MNRLQVIAVILVLGCFAIFFVPVLALYVIFIVTWSILFGNVISSKGEQE